MEKGQEKKGKKRLSDKIQQNPSIRTSIRFDYAPDICKDYKETGFCGYGDSCKFLHDRGDYKSGWQIEREYEQEMREKKRRKEAEIFNADDNDKEGDDDSDDDSSPTVCSICQAPFKKPVSTKCNHYFCQSCALKSFKKSSKCFVCGAETQGLFSAAKDLRKKK